MMSLAKYAKRRQHADAGFTLLELLMVMVVMTVIMMVAGPAFLSIGRGSEMRIATSAVYNTLNQSRQWAITHRELVTFHAGSTNYYVSNAEGRISPSETLPGSVRFEQSQEVTFKPDGSRSGDVQDVEIKLIGDGNESRFFRIKQLTGGVTIH